MAVSTRNRSAERLIDILVELQNYGVVSRHNLMKKYNITERTAYRDLNMLSPFIEACGDGKYRLISARAGNQSKESLHKSLARLLDTDAIFPDKKRPEYRPFLLWLLSFQTFFRRSFAHDDFQ